MPRRIIQLVSNGSFRESLLLYKVLHSFGIHGTHAYLPSLFKACSRPQYLPFAMQLHCTILKTGNISNTVTLNSLLSMYSKHSLVKSARRVFDIMPHRDSITWNSMINCYMANGCLSKSIELFKQMELVGIMPKPELPAAVLSLLSVCGRTGNLGLGKAIHARTILDAELNTNIMILTSLVDMYARCCDLDAALRVFALMPEKNVVSCNAIISGCIMNGKLVLPLKLFREMGKEGMKPDTATLITVLPACGELGILENGKEIHGHIFRHGFESEQRVVGALVDMYGRCKGAFRLALIVFERAEERDVVTWSSMMRSSSQNGDCIGTMRLFWQMQREGIKPNSVTILAVIAACVGLVSLDHGQALHSYILKCGTLLDVFVGNSLINMYAKCGSLDSSVQIFTEMPMRDSISYNSMIASYGLHGHGYDALRLFCDMQKRGFNSDDLPFLAVLSACNHSGLVDEVQKLFSHVNGDWGIIPGEEHYACFVDLLGRSGRLEDACEVIKSMAIKPTPQILTSLVSACRVHGRSEIAERLVLQLIDLEPENAANYTLLSALYAEAGNWGGLEEVRRVMKKRGVRKDSGGSRIEDGNIGVCPLFLNHFSMQM